jgi:hypothetical protein
MHPALTDSQVQQIEQICAVLANTRNMLRAGANGASRSHKTGPTLEQTIDRACVQAANLYADILAGRVKRAA